MSSTDISRVDVPATVQPEGQAIALPSDVSQAITQMAQIMQGMANMVRATNERMGMLEQQVRLLTKVTPAQASAISAAIRDRAKELCAAYRATGCEKATGNAIRRELRLTMGVQNVREVPRCEYSVALQAVFFLFYAALLSKRLRARSAEKQIRTRADDTIPPYLRFRSWGLRTPAGGQALIARGQNFQGGYPMT